MQQIRSVWEAFPVKYPEASCSLGIVRCSSSHRLFDIVVYFFGFRLEKASTLKISIVLYCLYTTLNFLLSLVCVLILFQIGSSYLCYILFIFGRNKQGIIVFVSFITNLSLWGGSAWVTLKWPSPFKLRWNDLTIQATLKWPSLFKLRCRLRVDKPPISERIKYKVACLCFSAVNGSGSACLSELLHVYTPSRTLRSSSDTRKTHG